MRKYREAYIRRLQKVVMDSKDEVLKMNAEVNDAIGSDEPTSFNVYAHCLIERCETIKTKLTAAKKKLREVLPL